MSAHCDLAVLWTVASVVSNIKKKETKWERIADFLILIVVLEKKLSFSSREETFSKSRLVASSSFITEYIFIFDIFQCISCQNHYRKVSVIGHEHLILRALLSVSVRSIALIIIFHFYFFRVTCKFRKMTGWCSGQACM